MKKTCFLASLVAFASVGLIQAQVPPPPANPPAGTPTYVPVYASPARPLYEPFFPPDAGPYVTVEGGPTFYQNGRLNNFGGPVSAPVHYNVGGSVDAELGYAFNQYVAIGFEFGFNGTSINNVPGYYVSDANLYNIPFMGNVTFSYPIPNSIVTPYIGGGVGGSDSVFDPSTFADNNFNNVVTGNEDDVVLAWEAYAGLRFDLSRNISLGIGYKYFGTEDPNFSYPTYGGPNFNVGFRGVETHSVMVSLNARF